jgi:predicted nucleic acid-binding protein
MILVLDEWVIHDLKGENGPHRRQEADLFLDRIRERCERVAVLSDSPWIRKAKRLMKETDSLTRQASRKLHGLILRDQNKTQYVDELGFQEIPFPVPPDDQYLVQTYIAANADVLVTSDQRLFEALQAPDCAGINVVLRNGFLRQYLAT